jgi:hypothetical protein
MSPPTLVLKTPKQETRVKQSAIESFDGFLLGLLLDPAAGGEIFLRNIGCLSTEDRTLHNRRCETLNSFTSISIHQNNLADYFCAY